jgi:hypothetical protein
MTGLRCEVKSYKGVAKTKKARLTSRMARFLPVSRLDHPSRASNCPGDEYVVYCMYKTYQSFNVVKILEQSLGSRY